MAKKYKKKTKKGKLNLDPINVILFILSIIFLILGYTMVNKYTNISTILLFLGYIVLIPASLLIKGKEKKTNN